MTDGTLSRGLTELSTWAVAAMNDAVVIARNDGAIAAWNGAAERLFGYTFGEIEGQNLTLLADNDRQWEAREIIARVSAGEVYTNPAAIRRSKSGDLLDVSLSWSPLRDDANELVGMVGVFRDVRSARRIDVALRRRRALDIEAGLVRALTELALDLDRLSAASADPEAARALVASLRLKVEALIADSRADAQQLEHAPVATNSGIADEIRRLSRDLIPASTATKLNVRDVRPPGSEAADALVYVATEALANAVRHSAAARIGVDFRELGDTYALTIQDDGGGFDLERVESGLGLRRMRLYAARVGAEISIFSIPGMGTTVTIFVPV